MRWIVEEIVELSKEFASAAVWSLAFLAIPCLLSLIVTVDARQARWERECRESQAAVMAMFADRPNE